MDGWIKIYRQILDNPFWTSEAFSRPQAWIDLLLLANHTKGYFYLRDHKIIVDRGQVGWSHLKLSERWKWSRSKVKKFINDLEKEQQVIQQQSHSTTVITIVNYEKYQGKEQQVIQQKSNRKTTEEQQKDTNKKDNNDNNENNDKIIIQNKDFENFKNWILRNAVNVSKMREPFTQEQFEKIRSNYPADDIRDVLLKMHNWKQLNSKNVSAYLTMITWLRNSTKLNTGKPTVNDKLKELIYG